VEDIQGGKRARDSEARALTIAHRDPTADAL
jgi:hypothetical protein